MTTPARKNPSELTLQQSRAANEGMVNVSPPEAPGLRTPPPDASASVAETCQALERLLGALQLALRSYDTAIAAAKSAPAAEALEALRGDLHADADSARSLLARLHDQSDLEASGLIAALTCGVQRVASVFGESANVGVLGLGESALERYMQELSTNPSLLPMAREALRRELIPASIRRGDQLSRIA